MKLQEYTASAHNFEECMKCTICSIISRNA